MFDTGSLRRCDDKQSQPLYYLHTQLPYWKTTGSFLLYLRPTSLALASWLFLPPHLLSLPLAATPHGPRTHPSTLTTLTMHLRINGLKECTSTLYQERTTTPTTSATYLTFHIPSSRLTYVTPMSPYHPTASSTSCLYTNSTYTTSHSLVHLKHNLKPYLEYSNTPLYINFRQLYF